MTATGSFEYLCKLVFFCASLSTITILESGVAMITSILDFFSVDGGGII